MQFFQLFFRSEFHQTAVCLIVIVSLFRLKRLSLFTVEIWFQGVKRGIMEQSDLLIVTKADGELEKKARLTQMEYISALKYMHPRSPLWRPKVCLPLVFVRLVFTSNF